MQHVTWFWKIVQFQLLFFFLFCLDFILSIIYFSTHFESDFPSPTDFIILFHDLVAFFSLPLCLRLLAFLLTPTFAPPTLVTRIAHTSPTWLYLLFLLPRGPISIDVVEWFACCYWHGSSACYGDSWWLLGKNYFHYRLVRGKLCGHQLYCRIL